jgi:hypothetical protein
VTGLSPAYEFAQRYPLGVELAGAYAGALALRDALPLTGLIAAAKGINAARLEREALAASLIAQFRRPV